MKAKSKHSNVIAFCVRELQKPVTTACVDICRKPRASTIRRDAQLAVLRERFQHAGIFTVSDIAAAMSCSSRIARHYARALVDAGDAVIAVRGSGTKPAMYRMVPL